MTDPNEHLGSEIGAKDPLPQQPGKVVFAPDTLLSEVLHTFESFHLQVLPERGCCMVVTVTRFTNAVELEFIISKRHVEVFQKLFDAVYTFIPDVGYTKKSQNGPGGQNDTSPDAQSHDSEFQREPLAKSVHGVEETGP